MKLLRSIYLKSSVIQQVRPHVGQRRVAERLRSLLHSSVYPSEIAGKYRPRVYFVNLLVQTDEQQPLFGLPGQMPEKIGPDFIEIIVKKD